MRYSAALGAMAVALTLSVMPASGAVRTFDLDLISTTTIAPLNTTLGTVTIKDLAGGGVDVLVNLLDGAKFVDTGGPHTGFAFNLDVTPGQISILSPNTRPGSGKHPVPVDLFVLQNGSQSATPYGTFSNGFDCTGCGPGASHAFAGPFEFKVLGVNVLDFIPNGNHDFFAADIIGPSGGTGSIAAGIPEPSTWALMLAGFFGLMVLGHRKRRQAAL